MQLTPTLKIDQMYQQFLMAFLSKTVVSHDKENSYHPLSCNSATWLISPPAREYSLFLESRIFFIISYY